MKPILIALLLYLFGVECGQWIQYDKLKAQVMSMAGHWEIKEKVFNEPYPFDKNGRGSGRIIMMEKRR